MGRKPSDRETKSKVVSTTWTEPERDELRRLAFEASTADRTVSMAELIRAAVYKHVFKRPVPK